MKKAVAVILALAAVVLVSGCPGRGGSGAGGSGANSVAMEEASKFLAEQGIDPQSLRVVGPDAFIMYEASQALAYDDQVLVVWGTILGALAECAPSGTVTIVNTAGGKPALVVKARSADIKSFTGGQINLATLMKRLQVSPAE